MRKSPFILRICIKYGIIYKTNRNGAEKETPVFLFLLFKGRQMEPPLHVPAFIMDKGESHGGRYS